MVNTYRDGNTNKWRTQSAEWSNLASDWSATASKWSAMSAKVVSSFQGRLSQEVVATDAAANCSCLGESSALDGKSPSHHQTVSLPYSNTAITPK